MSTDKTGNAIPLEDRIYKYLMEYGATDNECWYDATIGAKQLAEGLSSLSAPQGPERNRIDKLARELATLQRAVHRDQKFGDKPHCARCRRKWGVDTW